MSTAVSKDLATKTKEALAAAVGTAQGGATSQPMPELNGLILQLPGAPAQYLVLNGFRCLIPDPQTELNLFVPGFTVVSDINIGVVTEGPVLTSGAVLAAAIGSAPVYLVTNGVKMWIPTPDIFTRYQFNTGTIQFVAPVLIDFIPSGPNVEGPTTT